MLLLCRQLLPDYCLLQQNTSRRVFAILTACLLVSDPCRVCCKPPSLFGLFVEHVPPSPLFSSCARFGRRCRVLPLRAPSRASQQNTPYRSRSLLHLTSACPLFVGEGGRVEGGREEGRGGEGGEISFIILLHPTAFHRFPSHRETSIFFWLF